MSKKYFISSDIHSFYDEYMIALNNAGFDINNDEHIIVVLGDIFDRGKQPLEVYNFLKGLSKERRILIRGNHEILLRDLVKRGYPEKWDNQNGTLDTLYYIAGLPSEINCRINFYKETDNVKYNSDKYKKIEEKYEAQRKTIWHNKVEEIIDWLYSDDWKNYLETDKYIFVHSWIPTHREYKVTSKWADYYTIEDSYEDNWREVDQKDWEEATWGCPWENAKDGLNETDKIIVCGHWHTSDFFKKLDGITNDYTLRNPIYKSDKYKIIGIDACTASTKRVNVLVLEEGEL